MICLMAGEVASKKTAIAIVVNNTMESEIHSTHHHEFFSSIQIVTAVTLTVGIWQVRISF